MPIIASSTGGSTFTPHPAGPFAALCIDVDDLGIVKTTWQGQEKQQHKVDLWWFCGQYKDDEKTVPMLVKRRFTLSLAEQSLLRPFLEHWRGKKFTAEELRGFDLEKLIGVPCFIQISHNETATGTYANVDAIMKVPSGMQVPDIPADLVRPSIARREREAKQAAEAPAGAPSTSYETYQPPALDEDADDDLPF